MTRSFHMRIFRRAGRALARLRRPLLQLENPVRRYLGNQALGLHGKADQLGSLLVRTLRPAV